VSVTPQNQSSDSESGDEDDDVVRKLPANLNLTGSAHVATSPDDREPPTPTIPQVKMQPPTPVNNVKEEGTRRRLSTASVPNEMGISAVVGGVDRHDIDRAIVPTALDYQADAAVVRHVDQGSVGDRDHPHSDYHACPEEGLASTPRPRAIVDRDTESSRHLPPFSPSDPPRSDSTARKLPAVNPRLSADVQGRPQQPSLSTHSAPQSHPHITSDSSPGPRADSDIRGRDQITMTQVSEDPSVRIITKPFYA